MRGPVANRRLRGPGRMAGSPINLYQPVAKVPAAFEQGHPTLTARDGPPPIRGVAIVLPTGRRHVRPTIPHVWSRRTRHDSVCARRGRSVGWSWPSSGDAIPPDCVVRRLPMLSVRRGVHHGLICSTACSTSSSHQRRRRARTVAGEPVAAGAGGSNAMTRNVTSIGRRRFLQTGALGLGAGALGPGPAAGQGGGARPRPAAEPSAGRVRMSGDGLGLTPADQGRAARPACRRGPDRPRQLLERRRRRRARRAFRGPARQGARGVHAHRHPRQPSRGARPWPAAAGRAVVQAESHLFNDSGDCVQTLSGITLMPLAPGRGDVHPRRCAGGHRPHRPAAGCRDPCRRSRSRPRFAGVSASGSTRPSSTRVTAFARARGIGLHLDGARLFLQSACTGVGVAEYARPFDTVYVSLYKYFNAVSGAILAGPRALLDDMYRHTRPDVRGRGLPGAWPFAAVALHHLPGFVDRFRRAVGGVRGVHRIASPGTRRSGWNGCRPPRTSSGFGCPPPTPPASARGCATAVSIWGGRAPDGAVLVGVNETWNRATAEALAERFAAAL